MQTLAHNFPFPLPVFKILIIIDTRYALTLCLFVETPIICLKKKKTEEGKKKEKHAFGSEYFFKPHVTLSTIASSSAHQAV